MIESDRRLSFYKKSKTKYIEGPKKIFNLSTTFLLAAGVYPMSFKKFSSISRAFHSIYFWTFYLFFVVLNPVSKAMAIRYYGNIDDFTDIVSYLTNHVMAAIKIGIFVFKEKDLIRLVETMESEKFRHQNCENFSANKLIRRAVKTSELVFYIYLSFVIGMILMSILDATLNQPEQISECSNCTIDSMELFQRHARVLPYQSWYPFSTEISPNYELAFIYQIVALTYTALIVVSLDTLAVSFMIQITVQLKILSHNLRFIVPHAIKRRTDYVGNENSDDFIKTVQSLLGKYIEHHRAILILGEDFEKLFTIQFLLQFVCSLLATCMLLWQVSATPVMTAKFASMISYFGATGFQLFMYCWFGNEMMLESLSVADAAWDSGWYNLISKRYRHDIGMVIHRSQKVFVVTAGGFLDLTLDTFMMILRAAYSCFAVLKKTNN